MCWRRSRSSCCPICAPGTSSLAPHPLPTPAQAQLQSNPKEPTYPMPTICPPAYPLLLLKARGTWNPELTGRPAWRSSAGWSSPLPPHPQKGLALSPPPCLHANNKADNNNYSTSVSWVLERETRGPRAWHHTKRREQRLLQLGFIPILIYNHPIISSDTLQTLSEVINKTVCMFLLRERP